MKHIALLVLVVSTIATAAQPPVITWASDPVRPDETVLLRGGGFGTQPVVEFARLEDSDPSAKDQPALSWTKLPVLQASDDALKFVIPADARPGVFTCRVVVDGAASSPVFLNRPDVWWFQGDAGPSATPGGWLRIFGKCLGADAAKALVMLFTQNGAPISVRAETADGWSLNCKVPASVAPGSYALRIHNGQGGVQAWCNAGTATIAAPAPWPATVYNVLESCGPDAAKDMRRSLLKYGQPIERTKEVQAALAKAKAAGGGVVFFPAGRYHVNGPLDMPPKTVLKGEGMGLVTLWWGNGKFNLDGGGDQGLAKEAEPEAPANLIGGPAFGIEDMSLYLPLNHKTGIDGHGEVRLRRVRVRVDHLWALDGNKRPEGTIARLGHNFEVTDCDIIAKGAGLIPGEYGLIARNRLLAGKVPCPLGSARALIVEDNTFVSTYPTAYQNIAGVGQDTYYARNKHEALSAHQADFSFTFDSGGSAYQGTLAAVNGAKLTLAADPEFPKWANEKHGIWRKAVVCVVSGKGASQWRSVLSFTGREWTLAEPFAVAPDKDSLVTIVPLCGRALIVGNRFEDANWVNAGFGCALDVIYSGNKLVRCAELLNYGLASPKALQPNFNAQFFDNELSEGQSSININGSVRPAGAFAGQITQNIIHRREKFTEDNSGIISIQGALREVIVEGCTTAHSASAIRVDRVPTGVLLRHCRSTAGDLKCEGATQVP
ncbi:MAG TPA: hypothetical protein VGP72_18235 [Planctomycetota bacterium]|jgi:hypothetical protein